MIRVIIADDADLTLAGIQTFLGQHNSVRITGSHQHLKDLQRALAHDTPDVILLGDRLQPDLDIVSLVEQVRVSAPESSIIVLSHIPDGLVVHELLNCGVAGYLYKSDPLGEDLVQAVQAVVRGRPYLSPTVNAEYLIAVRSERLAWRLDPEARDVLHLMASGYRPQEIALMKNVPVRRIYWIGNRLRRHFGAETNAQLMVRAVEEGFLPL